jgi:hypothetical protein
MYTVFVLVPAVNVMLVDKGDPPHVLDENICAPLKPVIVTGVF